MNSANALVIYNKKLLLIQRDAYTKTEANKWCGPGGQVEEGETFLQGLKRELFEEICIIPKHIKYIGKTTLINEQGLSQTVAIYISYLSEDEKNKVKLGNEGQAIGFFGLESALELELGTNWKYYFNKYKAYLEKVLDGNNNMDEIDPEELGLRR